MLLKREPSMISEAKRSKYIYHGLLTILLAFILIIVGKTIFNILFALYAMYHQINANAMGKDLDFSKIIEQWYYLYLFGTVSVIIIVLVYARRVEKRSYDSLGLIRHRAWLHYLIGYGVGIIIFSSVIFILYLMGQISYEGITFSIYPIVIVFFIGFLIQGASEEIAYRGYLMTTLAANHKLWIAIIGNSIFFALMHMGNSNVVFLGIFNIFLFGVFTSIYALKTDNLWGVCGIHSAWNFLQGNIYGLQVSGNKKMPSIWHFNEMGEDFITGGAFGPEGGIVVTGVTLIAIVMVLFLKKGNDSKTSGLDIS